MSNAVVIINTSDAPIAFRYRDGSNVTNTVTIGAKADNGIIGRAQPKIKVDGEVWAKIRKRVTPLVGDGLTEDKPLRVINA